MRIRGAVAALSAAIIIGCSNGGSDAAAAANTTANAEQPARPRAEAGAERGVADPRAFVEQRYRTIGEGQGDPAAVAYSDRLRALFADDETDAQGGVGRLDFDYWSNSQDPQISNLRVTEQPVEGREDRRIVVARFNNGPGEFTNRYYFERVGGRWYLDDVSSQAQPGREDTGWTLSLLLKYGY